MRPQECAASGAGHRDGPHGMNGETQCEYCGQPPDECQPDKGVAFNEWKQHPIYDKTGCTVQQAMTHFDAGWERGTQVANSLLRELVAAHAEWDAKHWSQRNQPGAADRLMAARRKARDYVASLGVAR